jgi:glycosyltransferase involved in cell wall biosynthesis
MSAPAEHRIWIVVPAFNEARVIEGVVASLVKRYRNIVVVDDASSDATAERAVAGGARVLCHAINRGQGAALQTGIEYALGQGAEFVVTFDSDGQHDPEDIEALVAPVLNGSCDIAIGSRFLRHGGEVPIARRLLLKAAVLFTRMVSGISASDTHNGLRAFSRRAAKRIEIRLDRMAHASEILDQIGRMGLPWVEIPVRVRYTPYSRAKGQRATGAIRVVFDYLVGRLTR